MDHNEVIMERAFSLDGNELPCRFYRPVSDGQDYSCRYEIEWPNGSRARDVWGVDSVQAFLLAMQAAHADLLIRREHDNHDLSWLGGRCLGLPAIGSETGVSRD